MENKRKCLLSCQPLVIDYRLAAIQDKEFPTAAKFIVSTALSLQSSGLKLDAMSIQDMVNAFGFGSSVIKKAIKFLKESDFCKVRACGYKTKSGLTAKSPSTFIIDTDKLNALLDKNNAP